VARALDGERRLLNDVGVAKTDTICADVARAGYAERLIPST
jgi:hypothetical protein